MPIRFDRWIRSKLWAITARTPSSDGPFAAQSRDEPGAVLAPGEHDEGDLVRRVALGGVEDGHLLAVGKVEWSRRPLFRARAGCAGAGWRRCRGSSPRGCRAGRRRS